MESNKYYTPAIDDLFIGYENCEVSYKKDEWTAIRPIVDGIALDNVIDLLNGRVGYNSDCHVRTKYLDKEDVERCGWKLVWGEAQCSTFTIGHIVLTKFSDDRMLIDYSKGRRLFDGKCKSINELRKIMKMLGIK